MSKDNRTLTILQTVKAHLGVGNLEFADQVLQGHIDALKLEADAEKGRAKEKHADVRVGHSHSKVDVSQAHCHRAGKTETRMLPMVIPGDLIRLPHETDQEFTDRGNRFMEGWVD